MQQCFAQMFRSNIQRRRKNTNNFQTSPKGTNPNFPSRSPAKLMKHCANRRCSSVSEAKKRRKEGSVARGTLSSAMRVKLLADKRISQPSPPPCDPIRENCRRHCSSQREYPSPAPFSLIGHRSRSTRPHKSRRFFMIFADRPFIDRPRKTTRSIQIRGFFPSLTS